MNPSDDPDRPVTYQLKVKGMIDQRWSGWLCEFDVTPQDDETTLLTGQVADQAALFGLLNRIRDVGLTLLSLERLE